MLKRISLIASSAIIAGSLLLPVGASAQEAFKKRENVDYYHVVNFNFKPGHNDAAWEILYEKIGPAVRAMGEDFIVLDWETGAWDSTAYIKFKDGYGELEYATSPASAAFMASMAKQEGSEEAAKKVMKEWVSHIDNTSSDLAHMHLPPKAEEAKAEE